MNIPLTRYWSLLAAYLAPQRPRVILLAVLLVTSIGLELAGPQIVRTFIDGALAGLPSGDLLAAALLFTVVALVSQSVAVAETYVAESVGWTATNRLRAALALHCLRLDLTFHHGRTAGELIERIDGDVTALANFFSRFVIAVVGNVLLLAGVLILLWREDWRIGAATAIFAGAVLAAMLRLYAAARPLWAAVAQESALFFGFLGERLTATEDLRSSGATTYVLRQFTLRVRGWVRLLLRAVFAEQAVWMVALSLFAMATAVALTLGAAAFQAGAITVGAIYLIFQYTSLLIRPVSELQAQIQDLQQAGASIGRVEELFAIQPRLRDGAGIALPPGPLSLTLRSVSFDYGDDALVLHDVSCHLPPGTVLGLLGRTGSGKTSLARLLARLYDPTAGEVCLGGVDLRATRLADVRDRVGLVTQEVQLFGASVRDNLALFDPTIEDERILHAIRALGLWPWFSALPRGLETELTAGGLSAGEAQLLAFVRVFLINPGLVILDEASSRLDPATERLVEGAIDTLLAGRTAVIIAHRLATVQRADQIMILDDGRIVEYGARSALERDHASRFAWLLRAGLRTEDEVMSGDAGLV
jgi:ABC-type multidrug transport system fused ATPase/permease subunit